MELNILFLLPNLHQGGAQKTCIDLANAMANDHGCHVTIVVAFESSFYYSLISDKIIVVNLGLTENSQSGLKSALLVSEMIIKEIDFNNYSHIYSGWEYFSELVVYFTRVKTLFRYFNKDKKRFKLVAIIQASLEGLRKELNFSRKIFFDIQSICRLIFFDKIVGVNSSLKDDTNLFGSKKLEIIHSCVDIDRVNQLSSKEIDSIDLEVFNKKYIINVGRVNSQKNQIHLIDCFCSTMNKISYDLVFVGAIYDQELFERMQKRVSEYNAIGRIHFLGAKTNPFPLLKNAIANVSVSLYEGFPVNILETIALRKLVVSSKFKGYDDYLDQTNSLLFDINDSEKLTEILLYLNDMSLSTYNELTFNAYKKIEKLSPYNVSLKYLSL